MSAAKAGRPSIKAGRPSGETNVTRELLGKMADKPEMRRVTFEIPRETHTRIKMLAILKRTTISGVLRGLLSGLPADGDDAGGVVPELRGRLGDRRDLARMTIDMPVESHIRLKLFAARWRTSMVDVLRWLISGGAGD